MSGQVRRGRRDCGVGEGWMEPLGASGRVFSHWPAGGPILSPHIAVPVACSHAGWGQSAVPCGEAPPLTPLRRGHGGEWEQEGC